MVNYLFNFEYSISILIFAIIYCIMDEILENIPKKWLSIIYSGKAKEMLISIEKQLSAVANITPPRDKWFEWCRMTNVDNVSVVLLGQDPYPTAGSAHGLSFSCQTSIPSSLKNIYNCLLKQKLIKEIPTTGDLTNWAKQGVVLLNSSLSTLIGKTGSHIKLWYPYVIQVIQNLCQYHYDNDNQLIFMLWGNFAQTFTKHIDCDYHIPLCWLHPSPLAQASASDDKKFINCNHFKYINNFLKEDGKSPINWNPAKSHTKTKAGSSKSKSAAVVAQNDSTISNKSIKDNPRKSKALNESVASDFNTSAALVFNINTRKHIAFTDGGAHPNNKSAQSVAGYASVFISGPFMDKRIYGNLCNKVEFASNIRAEGVAIIRTLEIVNECSYDWDECDVITDCEFWVNMIYKYMPKWNISTFKSKANSDLTLQLWGVWNEVSKKGNVKILHMKSHGKSGWHLRPVGSYERFCYEQNDYVDKLCNYSRKSMKRGEETIDMVEYDGND
jgi:uracil-DNA glycosylase